jgi:AbrB family looped-hinge helix DNA binding protein
MNMEDIVEIGTVSSRGQICIPNNIRDSMGLEDGSKVLFLLTNDSLVMKRVTTQTFEELTKPLKEAMKKSKMKESDVADMVHKFRKTR